MPGLEQPTRRNYAMSLNSNQKSPQFGEVQPSQEFKNAVRTGSSIRAICGLCHRTYFQDDPTEDWEPGELQSLRESARTDPNNYIAVTESVHVGDIEGKEVVINCVCGGLGKYEDWIWKHRHLIAEYVAAIAKKKAEAAYSDEVQAEALQEGVKEAEKNLKFVKCDECSGYFPDDLLTAKEGRLLCEKCLKKLTLCEACNQYFDNDTLNNGLCENCRDIAKREIEEENRRIAEMDEERLKAMTVKPRDDMFDDSPF